MLIFKPWISAYFKVPFPPRYLATFAGRVFIVVDLQVYQSCVTTLFRLGIIKTLKRGWDITDDSVRSVRPRRKLGDESSRQVVLSQQVQVPDCSSLIRACLLRIFGHMKLSRRCRYLSAGILDSICRIGVTSAYRAPGIRGSHTWTRYAGLSRVVSNALVLIERADLWKVLVPRQLLVI